MTPVSNEIGRGSYARRQDVGASQTGPDRRRGATTAGGVVIEQVSEGGPESATPESATPESAAATPGSAATRCTRRRRGRTRSDRRSVRFADRTATLDPPLERLIGIQTASQSLSGSGLSPASLSRHRTGRQCGHDNDEEHAV